jgi:predicted lipoprotein with Yx(FWY)xxD motif
MHPAPSRRTMFSVAAIAAVAIVLAACGSSAKKTSTAAPPTGAAASSSSTAAQSSSSNLISTASSPKGQILVDAKGKSLYVFDKDTTGKIACATGCVAIWPPLTVPNGTSAPTGLSGVMATLGTVMRPDGTTQLTSDGRPLYTFSGDSGPGQVNGDGFMNIWHVAMASGNGSAPAASASASPSTSAPTTSSSSSGGYGY